MRPTGRFFSVILVTIAPWTMACAGAQQPDAAPDPTAPARAEPAGVLEPQTQPMPAPTPGIESKPVEPRVGAVADTSASAVDDFTMDITPIMPHLRLPEELAHSSYGVRTPGSDPLNGDHSGSGPFKLVEYIEDDHITVEKNAEY